MLLAAGFYFFYLVPQQRTAEQVAEAQSKIELLESMTERAVAISSAVQDMSPPPPDALLEDIDRRLDRAEAYLEDGKSDLEAGNQRLTG